MKGRFEFRTSFGKWLFEVVVHYAPRAEFTVQIHFDKPAGAYAIELTIGGFGFGVALLD